MVVLIIILIEMNRTLAEHLEGNSSVTFTHRFKDGVTILWTFTENTPDANQGFNSLKKDGSTVTFHSCVTRGNAY